MGQIVWVNGRNMHVGCRFDLAMPNMMILGELFMLRGVSGGKLDDGSQHDFGSQEINMWMAWAFMGERTEYS